MRRLSATLAAVCALVLVPASPARTQGTNGRIAYLHWIAAPTESAPEGFFLRLVQPDGKRANKIQLSDFAEFAFSPRGRRIAFSTSHGIDTMDLGGKSRRRVTTAVLGDYYPDWSPSGRRIVFARTETVVDDPFEYERNVWITDFRTERRLIAGFAPDWSSQGDVAFVRDGISVIRPDGSGLRRVVRGGVERFANNPSWSPDGQRIVFDLDGPGDGIHIATIRKDGSGFRRLTRGPWEDYEPTYSPDGKRIVFVRDRYPHGCPCSELLTMTTAGTHLRRVAKHGHVVGLRRVFHPDWQPRP